AQVIVAMDLHNIGGSWLLQLVLVLLGLNLAARLAVSALGRAQGSGTRVARAIGRGGSGEGLNLDALSKALPKWRIKLTETGGGAVRGLGVEGLVVLGLGLVILAAGYVVGTRADRGIIYLMPGTDDAARARFQGKKIQGDKLVPWRPEFTISCSESVDGTPLGDRSCILQIAGKPHKATLQARRDLEFNGRRLTWVGVRRVSGVGGFEVDVTHAAGSSSSPAIVGTPLDVATPEGTIATLLIPGNAPGDPVGLLADGPEGAAITVSARPRYMLEIAVSGSASEAWIWGGLTLFIIGLLLVGLAPTYRAVVIRVEDQYEVTVTGTGLLARPEPWRDAVLAQLGSGHTSTEAAS
ncbi:MAG: hypothetical protein ACI9WU_002260, partial [Myxococcota bacterium]